MRRALSRLSCSCRTQELHSHKPKTDGQTAQWQGSVLSNQEDAENFWGVTPGRQTQRCSGLSGTVLGQTPGSLASAVVQGQLWGHIRHGLGLPGRVSLCGYGSDGAAAGPGVTRTVGHCTHTGTHTQPCSHGTDTYIHTCFKAPAWLHAQWDQSLTVPQAAFGVAEGKAQEVQVRSCFTQSRAASCCSCTLGIWVQWQTWGRNPWC